MWWWEEEKCVKCAECNDEFEGDTLMWHCDMANDNKIKSKCGMIYAMKVYQVIFI